MSENIDAILKKLQDETYNLYETATEETSAKMKSIAEAAKAEMERVCKDKEKAREDVKNQLASAHQHAKEEIAKIQKETSENASNILANIKDQIAKFASAHWDSKKVEDYINETTKAMTKKINECNERVNAAAKEIGQAQDKYFEDLKKNLK